MFAVKKPGGKKKRESCIVQVFRSQTERLNYAVICFLFSLSMSQIRAATISSRISYSQHVTSFKLQFIKCFIQVKSGRNVMYVFYAVLFPQDGGDANCSPVFSRRGAGVSRLRRCRRTLVITGRLPGHSQV